MQDLVAQGKTVVSVLHELNVALMSDDMLILKPGGRVHTAAPRKKPPHIARWRP